MNQTKQPEAPFSVTFFLVTVSVTILLYFGGISITLPAFWYEQTHSTWWKWPIVIVLTKFLVNMPGEYGFHRYMLHRPFPFLRRLYVQHTRHHALTNVKLISVESGKGKVFNRYPILVETQYEASFFPWYSYITFIGVSLILYVPLQLLLPDWPIVTGGAISIGLSLCLYELLHMMEHLSFEEFWLPKILHPTWGGLWEKFYCFHLRHHADITSNENISGFFGIPLADFFFGTYAPWPQAFIHGETVTLEAFQANPPKPRFLIPFLDRLADRFCPVTA